MTEREEGVFSGGTQVALFVGTIVLSLLPAVLHQIGFTLSTGVDDYRDEVFDALEGAVEPIGYGMVQGMTAYTMLEWSVVILAGATAVLASVHFHVKSGAISLIIAIGAFWAGMITAFQLLAFHGFSIQVVDPAAFVQFNWTVGQGFMGLLVVGGAGLVLWRGNRREDFDPEFLAVVAIVVSVVAYVVIFQTAQAPELPVLLRPEQVVSRPHDLVPLGLFVVAAVAVLPLLHRMCQSIFSMALWLSAVPLIFSQIYMSIVSGAVFDAPFTWAQIAKTMAFGIIFGGLVWDYFRVCRTERSLERRLNVTDRRLRMFFENSNEAIAIFDDDCRIEDLNPRATEVFGWSRDEARGRDVTELLFPDDGDLEERRREFRRHLELFHREGECEPLQQIREVVITPPGETGELNIEYHTVPATEPGGSVFGLMGRDITERKELQLRMFQMDRLVAAGTLAAGVVHEIKNPMTYVTTNLELGREMLYRLEAKIEDLEDEIETPDVDIAVLDNYVDELDDVLESAREGGSRVQQIVEDMRVFSRTGDVETEPISVCDTAEVALRMTRGKVQRRATIETDFDERVPPVEADETRLSQVFVNIIVNAAQAMEKVPDRDHRLRLECTSEADRVVVRVRDTGPGMSDEMKSKIFRPFFTTKSKGEGTGLGLPLSKSIVESFGGEICVFSTPGEGTTFEVRLPVARPGDDGETDGSDDHDSN